MLKLADAIKQSVSALKGVQRDLDSAYQDTLLDVGKSLVFFTPVDTGAAESNWGVGEVTSYKKPIEPSGENGAASITKIQSQVKSIKAGISAIFFNNVDYIDELEDGKSPKNRAGMVTPTMTRVDGLWTNNLKKYKIIQ